MQDVKVRPYPSLNEMLNAQAVYGFRRVMKGSSFLPPLTVDFAQSLFDDLTAFHTRVPDAANSMILIEWINPRKSMLVSQRATSFSNRGKLMNFLIGVTYTDAANDAICRQFARDMGEKCRKEVEKSQRRQDVDPVTKEGSTEYVNYDCESNTLLEALLRTDLL
jgi:translation initiation factor 2B subunit (eIF-2B alpha/beta/delta family)